MPHRIPAWLALLLFVIWAAAIIVFYWLDIRTVYESQALLTTMNILFCSAASFLVAYLAARSYLEGGYRAVLLLGCGALAFAVTYLLIGGMLPDLNAAVTVHNAGVLMAGLCFLISAFWAYIQKPPATVPKNVRIYLGHAFLGILVLMCLLVLGTVTNVIPGFFSPEAGFTPLRQSVLVLTVIVFVLSAAGLGILYRRSRSPFLLWYSLGLLFIGLGMGTLIIEGYPATPLSWVGRIGQYMGGVYMIGAVWSLTKSGGMRITLEKALQESEQNYRRIVETANEGIWLVNDRKITLYVNHRMADMLGYTVEEMIGRPVMDFSFPEDVPAERSTWESSTGGKRKLIEFRVRKKDGSPLWVLLSDSPYYEDGRLAGMLGMFTDITDRKLMEDSLRASQANLALSQEIAHLGSYFWDTENNVVQWSDELYRILGYRPGEVQASNELYRSHIHPADITRVDAELNEFLLSPEPKPIEYRIIRRDGVVRWIYIQSKSVTDLAKNVLRVHGVVLDVTERKQAEDAIKESKLQAELYLDLMGHDINNMHQIATGYLELASEHLELDESGREIIGKPLEALRRSSKLIDNVRKLQRVHAGNIRDSVVDLGEVLTRVVSEYRDAAGVNITYSNGAGPHPVTANELLYDVFSNLVGNAIKHSNDNGTSIAVVVDAVQEDERQYYKVCVEDTGPGIADDMKGKVFNRLHRGETKARGMGLGLYLVRSLVESYNGRVWVEDRVPGDCTKGSRFVVMLPAAR